MLRSLIQGASNAGSLPPPLASSLLGNLLKESLGHCFSLFHVPLLVRCVFEFSPRTRRRLLWVKNRRSITIGIAFIYQGTVGYNLD